MVEISERAELEAVQDALKSIKKALRNIEKVNRDAGRPAAANAAYKWRQEAGVFHARATEDMFLHFPEQLAGEIVTRGGGDR